MNQIIELLKSHRSIRRFTDQPVPQMIVEELVSAGQSAASSSFIQACTVIQVNDPADRARMAGYAGDQAHIREAPLFLVFCADMQRHKLACEMHDSEMLAGFTEQFITATVDCALFAQNVMTGAESLGLGGVYIGGIRNQIAAVADLLELPGLVYPVFGLCLGYPDQDPEVKPRLPLQVVLKQDRYQDREDRQSITRYDREIRTYYATRSTGARQDGWSAQIAGMLARESRPHMLAFLKSKGFLLR